MGRSFDRYVSGSSLVHRLDARVKLIIEFAFVISLVAMPNGSWWAFGTLGALAISASLISKVGLTLILKRSLFVLPFSIVAVPSIFTQPGSAVWSASIWDTWTITATSEGLEFAGSVAVKSWISTISAALLISVTRFSDIARALIWMRMPGLLVEIVASTYRYSHLITVEAKRMMIGRSARSAALAGQRYKSTGNIRWKANHTGHMVGSLFLRTLARSERIHMAMLARGYVGENPRIDMERLSVTEVISASSIVILLVAIAVIANLI